MHRSWCESNNQMWFNQLQIAAAVLRVWRLQSLWIALSYPAKRPTLQTAPSQDWGEDDGELMRPDSTSGALQHLLLLPHKCLLLQLPHHPLWLPPNPPAVQGGGLAQTPCQNEFFKARARQPAQRVTPLLTRNAGAAVAKSIRQGSTSLRKTSWKMESTLKNLTP